MKILFFHPWVFLNAFAISKIFKAGDLTGGWLLTISVVYICIYVCFYEYQIQVLRRNLHDAYNNHLNDLETSNSSYKLEA